MQSPAPRPRPRPRPLPSARPLTLIWALTALGFATLDGDRTRWPSSPTYSISGRARGVASGDAAAVRSAFGRWQGVQGGGISFREVTQRPNITVEFTADWPAEFAPQAAGVTLTYRQGGVISSAEVYINNRDFEWSVATPTPAGVTDVEGVVTHELGHAIGLTHSFHFEATMYWSGGSEELRTLDADDERGLRFLYAGLNAGLLCDTCESHADCAGGQCFDFGGGLAFCGEPCGPAPGYSCPANAGCFNLQDGSTSCAPLSLACSDMAESVAEEGDYCFGAAQCQAGLVCAVGAGSSTCVRTGAGAFGETCTFNDFCSSGLCLPFTSDHAECAEACDPRAPRCPQGAECVAVSDPSIRGLCVPPGQAQDGEACDGAASRCAAGLDCTRGVCGRGCEPYGECPQGFGCTPRASGWRCEELAAPFEGDPCVNDDCGGGLYCLRDRQRCVAPCDPAAPAAESCGGRYCLALSGLGVCSPGAGEVGDPCADSFDCADFICLSPAEAGAAGGGGGLCASPCAAAEVGGASSCPAGWSCVGGARPHCAPTPPAPAGGAEAPAGGAQTPAGGAQPSAGGAQPSAGGAEAPAGGGQPSPGGVAVTGGGAGAQGERGAQGGGAACAQPAGAPPARAPLALAALAALALMSSWRRRARLAVHRPYP